MASSFLPTSAMGSSSGFDDFAFPPGQVYIFGSFKFIADDFGKLSLSDLDPNQSGSSSGSVPFGLPNAAESYSKVISDCQGVFSEIQDSAGMKSAYPKIRMQLSPDLAAVFGSTPRRTPRTRSDSDSGENQSGPREVVLLLQKLGSVPSTEIESYLMSRPEIPE